MNLSSMYNSVCATLCSLSPNYQPLSTNKDVIVSSSRPDLRLMNVSIQTLRQPLD